MKRNGLIGLVLTVCLLCAACTAKAPENHVQVTETPSASPKPAAFELPDDIRIGENGVPVLRVHVTENGQIEEMDLEEYLCGVLAGEMKNDWPMEALKAQAILARTFVIKFISEKESQYAGADVSTDINEAQAYDAAGINERIREAVRQTRGKIVCYQNDPIYAWFHSHSGGRTAVAAEGLGYKKEAPYTVMTDGTEDGSAAAEAAEWSVQFGEEEVLAAAKKAGVDVGDRIDSVSSGGVGESGRLKTLKINGKDVSANEFRIAIGSSKMKSTLLTSIAYADGTLALSGRGYGHGVGMSQWGAYAMANTGNIADEIIHTYFKGVDIVQIWN